MTVAFVSNYYNHHQSSFSESMNKQTGGNYYFIATEPMEEERKNMGWGMSEYPQFVKFQYESEESRKECQNIIDSADVVIIGSAPNSLIKTRLKEGKLTFRYSERPYKKDVEWYRLIVHSLRAWINSGRFKNLYMLCASAYTSSDLLKIHSFKNKCFKWGYFPKVKHYDDISKLIHSKRKASILWVARLIEWKHPDASILVAKRLKDAGYDFNLSIIGVGPLKEHLQTLIKEYGLEKNVQLLGAMKPEEVRNHMEQSEIFLFTSDKNEGWGAVLNESMNSGCAVVSSHAIGSTPFLIEDGVNGLIYKDGDIDDLYSKVKYLLEHDKERELMGVEAYHTLVDMWNAQTASTRLLQLIESLISNNETSFTTGPCSRAEILYDKWK